MHFVDPLLFPAILLTAIFFPFAIAEIFEDFALLAGVEIDEPLLFVLLREVREARFEGLFTVRAEFFARRLQLKLDARQAAAEGLLQAAPRVRRFLREYGHFFPDPHHHGDETQQAQAFEAFITQAELQYGLQRKMEWHRLPGKREELRARLFEGSLLVFFLAEECVQLRQDLESFVQDGVGSLLIRPHADEIFGGCVGSNQLAE